MNCCKRFAPVYVTYVCTHWTPWGFHTTTRMCITCAWSTAMRMCITVTYAWICAHFLDFLVWIGLEVFILFLTVDYNKVLLFLSFDRVAPLCCGRKSNARSVCMYCVYVYVCMYVLLVDVEVARVMQDVCVCTGMCMYMYVCHVTNDVLLPGVEVASVMRDSLWHIITFFLLFKERFFIL